MRVSIWDVDYYYNKKNKNIDCMKISSYHKQKGDFVHLIQDETDTKANYDIIYIVKNSEKLQSPPLRFLDNDKSRIWGKGFQYWSTYCLPPIILACRPDYLLYPNMDTVIDRADQVRFFDNRGNRIKKMQDWHNTFKNKKVLVTDEFFWNANKKDILIVLESLKCEKSVVFQYKISLKRLIYDKDIKEYFLKLNFTKNSLFQWCNDVGDDEESINKILNFLTEVKENAPTTSLGTVNIQTVLTNHFESSEQVRLDIQRCMETIIKGKKLGVNFKLQQLNGIETPYTHLFETLIKWTEIAPKSALLEFLVMPIMKKQKISIEEIYNNPIKWTDEKMREILRLIVQDGWPEEWYLLRWHQSSLDINKINFKKIKENI